MFLYAIPNRRYFRFGLKCLSAITILLYLCKLLTEKA